MDVFSKRPLFTSCMLFLLSAVISLFLPSTLKPILATIFGITFISLTVITAFGKLNTDAKYSCLCFLLCSLMVSLSTLSSYLFFDVQQERFDSYYGDQHTLKAYVTSIETEKSSYSRYTISVMESDGIKNSHDAYLTCEYGAALDIGDVIIINALAEEPKSTGGRYNEKASMLSKGIFVSYTSYDMSNIFITEQEHFDIKTFFADLNSKISRVFTQNIPGEAGNMSSALLLGNRELLSDTTVRDFSRAGVSHILALSGMHMTIVMGAIMFVLKRFTTKSYLIAIISSVCSVFYLALTGFSVSATRSVIMLLIVYFSIIVEGIPDSPTSLSIAGFLIFLVSPGSVLDAAFWMSFASTLGLLVFIPPLNDFFNDWMYSFEEPKGKIYRIIMKPIVYVIVTFAAGVFALIPLIAVMCVFIKEISLASIISSAVLSLPSTALILLSLLFLPFHKLPTISYLLSECIQFITDLVLDYCSSVSHINKIVVSLNYPFAAIAAVIICLSLAYCMISKHSVKVKSLIPFAICFTVFVFTAFVYDNVNENKLRVTYINASRTSDMVVISESNTAVICDISNGSKSSYNKALDELYEAGATEITAIMLTRYSYAHNSTLNSIFAKEMVRELWLPYPSTLDEYYKMEPIYETAIKHGVTPYIYKSGDPLYAGDLSTIEAYRSKINRSTVPISLISIKTISERVLYVSPSLYESDLSETAEKMFLKAKYVIFGNKGPVTKNKYTVKNHSRIDAIAFADTTTAAYFDNTEIISVPIFIVPEKIEFYIDK